MELILTREKTGSSQVKMRYAGISEPFQLARCYERDPKTKKTKSMQVVDAWLPSKIE